MKKLLFIIGMIIPLLLYSQGKNNLRDVAVDYVKQNINFDSKLLGELISDKYDKMPNGGYLVTLEFKNTKTVYEKGLVPNQYHTIYGTFNFGVREGLVGHKKTENRIYIVFTDRYGTAYNFTSSALAPHFHFFCENVWITNKGYFEDRKLDFDCNFSCYTYKGDLLWKKNDIAVFAWANTENTLYLVGNYIGDKRSFVSTVDTKTFEFNEKLGNSNVIPFSIDLADEGVIIMQKDATPSSNSNISSYIIPYTAKDRKFQIEKVINRYNLNKASDQVALGERYLIGNIVEKNAKKAVELFEKAANQNNDVGLYKLGKCYKEGIGVPMDKGKALSLFEKSANKGNTSAMLAVSNMYAEGDGVDKNLQKALYWKEYLAFKGNKEAQNYILSHQSIEYEKVDIPTDELVDIARRYYDIDSYDWSRFCYERAINKGSEEAMFEYGRWLYKDVIVGNGTEENKNKSIELLTVCGEKNNVEAQKMLATLYHGVPNIEKEMYWTIKAAENGDADLQLKLGEAYLNGYGVPKDKKLSAVWCEKAALQGNQNAIALTAANYFDGKGVKKNLETAMSYFLRLRPDAQLNFADRVFNGINVKKDKKLGILMYENIAQHGNKEAVIKLAICYLEGEGVTKDKKKAFNMANNIANVPFTNPYHGDNGDIYYIRGKYYEECMKEYGAPSLSDKYYKEAYEAYERAIEHGCNKAEKAIVELKGKYGGRRVLPMVNGRMVNSFFKRSR